MKYLNSYNESLFSVRSENIKNICSKYKITNYTINDDLSIDVDDNVHLDRLLLHKLPLKFNIVNGDFYCNRNNLINLNGCPNIIKGEFYCNDNNLTSLEYCPKEIEYSLFCHNNKLFNLIGCTQKPASYSGNPIFYLNDLLLNDLKVDFMELVDRLEEFDVLKGNIIDSISLETLYNFYDKKLNIRKFNLLKTTDGYEIS